MSAPMQLLVSVANATEAREAVDGGADVIDAKDPEKGALGAVSSATLRQICAAVAGRRVVSAALGDADDEATIGGVARDCATTGVGVVKIGFAGITSAARVGGLVAAAVRGVRSAGRPNCGVVAVAYADTGGTTSIDRTALVDAAARAGASGVLLDTAHKEGPGLSRLVSPETLTAWVALAHERGLTVALAGKVMPDDLPFVRDTGADIVGVRGAVCATGRSSPVVESKIRALRSSLVSLSLPGSNRCSSCAR